MSGEGRNENLMANNIDAEIVQFPLRQTGEYFGGCQECAGNDGYLNIGAEHWFYCERHKTKWSAGENIFSGWYEENNGIWNENQRLLSGFVVVEPLSYDPSLATEAHPGEEIPQ